MDRFKDGELNKYIQERNEIFDEREAIRIAIQDLKEQTRMDYELYFESRKIRNEQIKIMLDRLRELDHRDEIVEIKYKHQVEELQNQLIANTETSTNEKDAPSKEGIDNSAEDLARMQKYKEEKERTKLKDIRESVSANIQEEILAKPIRGSFKRVSSERIETLIVTYLRGKGETPMKYIKSYVEKEVNSKWKNFGDVMQKAMNHNKSIKRGEKRGYYYLEDKPTE